jgi:hypothetical protein
MPRARERYRVHRNPHSTYRDDAYALFDEAGWREDGADLGETRSDIFFPRNLDDPNHVELASEIRSLAQRSSWVGLASRAVARPKRSMI